MILNLLAMTTAPGIRAVAAEAGVSHQTVSRVLNNHPNVRAETRVRVTCAMEKLSYVAHNGARSMRSRRSRVIGVLVASTDDTNMLGTLALLESELRNRRLWMLVAFLQHNGDVVDDIRHLRDATVDGIVLISRTAKCPPAGDLLGVTAVALGPTGDAASAEADPLFEASRAVESLLLRLAGT